MWRELLDELPRFFSYYNLVFFARALGTTFALSAIGCVVGFALGFMLAAVRLSTRPALAPVRVGVQLVTELFRRIPFLVTLMLVFFIFQALKADLSMFTVALISVCPSMTSGAPGRSSGVFSCIQVIARPIDSAVPVSASVIVMVVMPSSVSTK